MKKVILAFSTILLASVAHAGPFSAIYSLVQKSAAKSVQLRQVEREVSMTMGGVDSVVTRIPAHEFTLANGIVVSMEDVGKIVRNSVYDQMAREIRYTPRVDLVITLPLSAVPKTKEGYAALVQKLKFVDDEPNVTRGLTRNGPKGFSSSLAETNRLTVDVSVDAGQLDEILQTAFAKLGAVAL